MNKQITTDVGSTWLKSSIMQQRGVAAGSVGSVHHLDEKMQGEFAFTVGPYSTSVLEIDPGDRVIVDTIDTFSGKMVDETTSSRDVIELPYIDPQNGPIIVRGAEPGDVLAVHIESMEPRGLEPSGTCCLIPDFGALAHNHNNPNLHDPLPEIVKKIRIEDGKVHWSDEVSFDYKPHLGAISCSPEMDSINSMTADQHGGNMDMPDICPGNIIYLPVRAPGARLFLGDAHACQGDGEVCGCAVEYPTTTTIKVDLIKGWKTDWPRLETPESIMAISSARPLEDAVKIAFYELIQWMVNDYGWDKMEAYMLLTQVARVRLGNIVDPKFSVGAMIDKKYLTPSNR